MRHNEAETWNETGRTTFCSEIRKRVTSTWHQKGLRGRRFIRIDLHTSRDQPTALVTAVRPFRAAPGTCRAKRSCTTSFFIDLTLSSSEGLTRARIFTDGMFHEAHTSMHWLDHETVAVSGLGQPPTPNYCTSNTDLDDLCNIPINRVYIAHGLFSRSARPHYEICPAFSPYSKSLITESVCKQPWIFSFSSALPLWVSLTSSTRGLHHLHQQNVWSGKKYVF